MACPTCDHTMQGLTVDQEPHAKPVIVHWCPRCGTLKSVSFEHVEIDVPMLVTRVTSFADGVAHASGFTYREDVMRRLHISGVEEAFRRPNDRVGEAINRDLLAACEAAMRVETLWMPPNPEPGHVQASAEFAALAKMRDNFKTAIQKAKG